MKNYTLMHEHITIDLSGVKNTDDTRLDCFDITVREFKKLYEYGVRRVLDVTNRGMGRDLDYIRRVEKETGIKIPYSTGFYKEPFFPEYVYTMSIDELANLMIDEYRNMNATAIGEIGSSKGVITQAEQKVFDAAIIAQKETGAILTTHTSLGTLSVEQAKMITERGVEPDRVIIGHMDLSQNIDQILETLSYGVNIAFDTIGKNDYAPDSFRVKALKRIKEEGLLHKVVLSLDITRKSHMKENGGIGYSYLFETFIPMMKEAGLTDRDVDTLLADNPNRLLGEI